MKYKYIGTEEQLIEHGFKIEIVKSLRCNNKGALKNTYNEKFGEIYIPLFNSMYGERIIQYSTLETLAEDLLEEDIQDLIDANLVEVIE